jgi:hypothetical protein
VRDGREFHFVRADDRFEQFAHQVFAAAVVIGQVAELHPAFGRDSAHRHRRIAMLDQDGESGAQDQFARFPPLR